MASTPKFRQPDEPVSLRARCSEWRWRRDASRPLGALAASVAVAFMLTACSKPDTAPEPIRAVRTQILGGTHSQATQELAGEIRARTEARLSFRVGGKLTQRPVQVGDAVRKGQVLARLDPLDLQLVEQSAQAAVQAATVQWTQAEAELKRFQGLRDQGFISEAELERRSSTAATTKAQLAQATAQADVQGRQTAHGVLTADANGVITAVDAEPGMVVAAGGSVVRMALDGPRDIVFSVPEDRVDAIRALQSKPGMMGVRLWSAESAPLKASVREIAAAADTATRTFTVKADLQLPAGTAAPRLGQTATVILPGPLLAGVFKLPLPALLQQQGRNVVWLLDPATMTVKLQPVTVAAADGNELIISAGLMPGQEVVTAGVHVLTPGLKVKRYAAELRPGTSVAPASAAPR